MPSKSKKKSPSKKSKKKQSKKSKDERFESFKVNHPILQTLYVIQGSPSKGSRHLKCKHCNQTFWTGNGSKYDRLQSHAKKKHNDLIQKKQSKAKAKSKQTFFGKDNRKILLLPTFMLGLPGHSDEVIEGSQLQLTQSRPIAAIFGDFGQDGVIGAKCFLGEHSSSTPILSMLRLEIYVADGG